MPDIKEGFSPYKEFRYDEDQDAYELMSRWTSTDTVYLQDGSSVTDALSELDTRTDNMIADNTISENSTWSSTKLSADLTDLSTEIAKKAELDYKVLYPKGLLGYDSTWEVDMFEGWFSVSRNQSKVFGIIDRWGEAITYITPADTSLVSIHLITSGGKQKVEFINESNVNILVMILDNGHFKL